MDRSEWTGEFFPPDEYQNRFFGEITFSPEDGVILSYHISNDELENSYEMLHGILDNGKKCTLFGDFSPKDSGFRMINGLVTKNGKQGFPLLAVGEFFNTNELFSEVSFSFTGMQEFFFPKGSKDLIKFSNNPLFSIETNYGKVEVSNSASFSSLNNKDVTSQIYNQNKAALLELKEAFESIDKKHEGSPFMLKKDISYMLTIKSNEDINIQKLYEHIIDISNLFSVLTYNPLYPETIRLKHNRETEYPIVSDIYPSLLLESKTVKLCKSERSHLQMPITMRNIDLSKIITKWLEQSKMYSVFISSLQYETGYRNMHSLHGELVLYATQFESISHNDNVRNVDKYSHPVETYGCNEIKILLITIFEKTGMDDFGIGISDLRNEIAHVGKPKRLLSILSMKDMMSIAQLLHLTIVGYILYSLEIEHTVIDKYQNKFMPE